MKISDITHEELETYTRKLIPKLARYPPGHWVQISEIAHNVERFIQICQHLANIGAFDDEEGMLQIDISQDSLVRLNPYAWEKKLFQKTSPYDRKNKHKKQGPA